MSAALSSGLNAFDNKFDQVTGYRPSRQINSALEGFARVTIAAYAARFAYSGAKEIANEGLSFQAVAKMTAGTVVTAAIILFPAVRKPTQDAKKAQ